MKLWCVLGFLTLLNLLPQARAQEALSPEDIETALSKLSKLSNPPIDAFRALQERISLLHMRHLKTIDNPIARRDRQSDLKFLYGPNYLIKGTTAKTDFDADETFDAQTLKTDLEKRALLALTLEALYVKIPKSSQTDFTKQIRELLEILLTKKELFELELKRPGQLAVLEEAIKPSSPPQATQISKSNSGKPHKPSQTMVKKTRPLNKQ